MGDGDFRPPGAPKPLNRSSEKCFVSLTIDAISKAVFLCVYSDNTELYSCLQTSTTAVDTTIAQDVISNGIHEQETSVTGQQQTASCCYLRVISRWFHSHHLSLVHSFILNWRLGSLTSQFHRRPFPYLSDWFYGLNQSINRSLFVY